MVALTVQQEPVKEEIFELSCHLERDGLQKSTMASR